MLKIIKTFSLFFLLHAVAWGGTHYYLSQNPKEVLIVVDTSFAMKPHFPAVKNWISDFKNGSRYTNIIIGTDKAALGELSKLNSMESIYRISFGRINKKSLDRYSNFKNKKYFLSDGSITVDGWNIITFD